MSGGSNAQLLGNHLSEAFSNFRGRQFDIVVDYPKEIVLKVGPAVGKVLEL
jgi:hypothetical protein